MNSNYLLSSLRKQPSYNVEQCMILNNMDAPLHAYTRNNAEIYNTHIWYTGMFLW